MPVATIKILVTYGDVVYCVIFLVIFPCECLYMLQNLTEI